MEETMEMTMEPVQSPDLKKRFPWGLSLRRCRNRI